MLSIVNRAFERGPQSYRDAPGRIWPDHAGGRTEDAAYSVRPDGRIGEVLTAWSNQTRSGFVPRPRKQLAGLLLVGLVVGSMATFFGGVLIAWLLGDVLELRFEVWLPFVISGVLTLAAGWLVSRPRAACTYVGTEGIANHQAGMRRTDDVMRFDDAAHLYIRETNRYTNGVYQGTDFKFTWKDASGAIVFSDAGTRFVQGMWKDLEIPAWAFLCAAEVQWNRHRWARVEAEWSQHGRATFGDVWVREGEFSINGEVLRVDEVESITIERGFLTVRQVGAKKTLFGTKGITTREVSTIADFPLFLQVLQRAGFSV